MGLNLIIVRARAERMYIMPDEILKLIERISTRLSSNQQIEEDKIELKRQWYDLKELKDLNEFLKDIVSIVNTPGLTGHLIIGIDKNGKYYDAPFIKSGLRDQSDLHKLFVKYVDLPFHLKLYENTVTDTDGEKTISVIEIPPSIEKPHFIRRYTTKNGYDIENYIPIRKTTGIFPANRADVEFMYYDRKNIEPDYALSITSYKPRPAINYLDDRIAIEYQLAFQNYGRRPIAIVNSTMLIPAVPNSGVINDIKLNLLRYAESSVQQSPSYLSSRYLKVGSNEVETLMVYFQGPNDKTLLQPLRALKCLKFYVSAVDTNGNIYQSGMIESVS